MKCDTINGIAITIEKLLYFFSVNSNHRLFNSFNSKIEARELLMEENNDRCI